jgi:hypothetical protein
MAFSLGADDSHEQHYGINGRGHLNWSAVLLHFFYYNGNQTEVQVICAGFGFSSQWFS